jgi:hypothetical protein
VAGGCKAVGLRKEARGRLRIQPVYQAINGRLLQIVDEFVLYSFKHNYAEV